MPKLSKPGKYKFTIEYRTHSGTQVGLFEKTFEGSSGGSEKVSAANYSSGYEKYSG